MTRESDGRTAHPAWALAWALGVCVPRAGRCAEVCGSNQHNRGHCVAVCGEARPTMRGTSTVYSCKA
eukprot:2038698-Prymnesium_polylepis.1